MSKPVWRDIMKYDGSVPEPPYATASDLLDQIAELETQLAACAAGAWRTDVENAEIGQFYWCCYGENEYEACSLNMMYQWRNTMNCYMPPPIAFAVPNPPQVTT